MKVVLLIVRECERECGRRKKTQEEFYSALITTVEGLQGETQTLKIATMFLNLSEYGWMLAPDDDGYFGIRP